MKKILVSLMLLVMTALSAHAQFEKDVWYVNASLTGLDLSHSKNEGTNFWVFALTGGAFVADNVAVLLNFKGNYVEHGMDETSIGAQGRYYFSSCGIYGGLGMAYKHLSCVGFKKNLVCLTPEVGYAFFLGRNVTIEPSVYYDLSFSNCSEYSKLGFKIGFGFLFLIIYLNSDEKSIHVTRLARWSFGSVFAQKKGFDYKFYGQVRTDLFYNTRSNSETVDGLFYMYPLDENLDPNGHDLNGVGNGNFYTLYTRLGVDVTGPMLGKAKTSAKVEVDFRGSGTTYSLFRIRHVYFNLDWGKSALLVGQTWHPLYGDVAPEILNLNMGAPYQPFSRAPQIRYRFTSNNFMLTLLLSGSRSTCQLVLKPINREKPLPGKARNS